MTKEELKQEAEEYAEGMAKYYASTHEDCIPSQFEKYLRNAYISSAEPREKRVEELEKACEETQELLDKQIEATYKLDKENTELKEKLLEQKQYTAFKCNEFVKKKEVYEREHFLLNKAKEIIKKLKALYLYPVITKNDVKRQDEILSEVEQFLKYSEVEKCGQ